MPVWLLIKVNPAPGLVHTNMSGSGRPRTSSFAEPPGAPGSAAAGAGLAVAGGSSTGKPGASQASGTSSTSFGNLKLSRKYYCINSATSPAFVLVQRPGSCVLLKEIVSECNNVDQSQREPLAGRLTCVSAPANVSCVFH